MSLDKKLARLHFKEGRYPSYMGGVKRTTKVQADLEKNMRPYLKNN
jgi:hypothetical protein